MDNNIYKYSELETLEEIKKYVEKTYSKHYSTNKIQTLDLIMENKNGIGFLQGNILKYAFRFDKKGTPKEDVMKIIHYAMLLLHFMDQNSTPNEDK